ncbi:MAG: methyltransferase domain-containing protein [Gammaproteobacteria bacterium]|nr:methyltransferase domain-containing protein [Gammaproteobacteria bacterium]
MIDEQQNLSILIALQWQDKLVSYTDRHFVLKTNFWRDIYPAVFDYQIKRADLNQTLNINYKAGDLIDNKFNNNHIKIIPIRQFNRYYNGSIAIEPAIGRFYPRGMIEGVADCFKMDNRPFRVLDKTEDTLTVDLNHPLAQFPLKVSATITDIFDANQQNGGRCNDIAETITTNGAGFQVLSKIPYDFSQGMPFIRKIEEDDGLFYDAIETTIPVDQVAIEQLQQFYNHCIQNNSIVLDLMAATDSYLPNTLKNIDLTGLGVKEDDLKTNQALNHSILHNINTQPDLPFDDQSFDAVICSFGIEYITQPIKIFEQVARILKPNGVFIVAFSDRFFDKKAIALWDNLHSFERMGLVLEYFRQADQFNDLQCESIRGLVRHEDDPFINKTAFSCPMFILSGKKR